MSFNAFGLYRAPVFEVPAGDPGSLQADANLMDTTSQDLARRADEVVGVVRGIGGWTGPGRTKAIGQVEILAARLHQVAAALSTGAAVTRGLADQIAQAQAEVAGAQSWASQAASQAASSGAPPSAGLFDGAMGAAIRANGLADEVKKAAAGIYRNLTVQAPGFEPPPMPDPPKRKGWRGWFNIAVEAASWAPVLGTAIDLARAGVALSKGDYKGFMWNVAYAAPGADLLKLRKVAKGADALRGVGRGSDEIAAASRSGDALGIRLSGSGGGFFKPRVDKVQPVGKIDDLPRGFPKKDPNLPAKGRDGVEPPPPTAGTPLSGTGFDRRAQPQSSGTFVDAVRGTAAKNLGSNRPGGQASSAIWSRTFRTPAARTLVRISFESGDHNESILVDADEVRGLDEADIKSRYGVSGHLEVADVVVPPGTRLRESAGRPTGPFNVGWTFADLARSARYEIVGGTAGASAGAPRLEGAGR